jgi:phage gp45-like
MKGEAHEGIEAPQNYGFTSVVADATKGKDGQIEQGAEGFMSFIGGSRSFPVCGIMDDRRHRLLNLAKDAAKGAVAMFGLKDWGQQFLITDDGIHMTGNKEKKIRFQLVENNNKQQQQSGGGQSAGTHAAGGNGAGGDQQSGGQQQNKPTGQKSLHKQEAKTFHEISEEAQHLARGDGHHKISDKKIINYYKDETKSNQVDDRHSHIRYGDNRIFSDTSGCWSTVAIAVKPDPDQSAATLAAWEERQAAFRADAGTVEMTRRLASAWPDHESHRSSAVTHARRPSRPEYAVPEILGHDRLVAARRRHARRDPGARHRGDRRARH